MSQKLKFYNNWNKNWNIIKTQMWKKEMSQKLICHQNWNVTKTEILLRLKFHQNWIVTKTEVSLKLKCYQNWNVTKCNNVFKNQNQNSKDWLWLPFSNFVDFYRQNKETRLNIHYHHETHDGTTFGHIKYYLVS